MIFSFLNPVFLVGLPLIAVPIIIHLFSIRKAKVLKFPETKFIKLAVNRTLTKIKLRQLLLLIIRILIIAILVLLFSRPVMQRSGLENGNKDNPLAVCLLLDNSYSMGAVFKGKSAFQRGKETCSKLLSSLRSFDSVSFALVSDTIDKQTQGFTTNTSFVNQKINEAKLSFRTTSFMAGVNYGYQVLKEAVTPNKQIIIVTDFALNGFTNGNNSFNDPDKNVRIIFVDVGEEVPNVAINSVKTTYSPAMDQYRFTVSIDNPSDTKYYKVPVSLILNGNKAGYGFFDSLPGEKADKNLFANSFSGTTDTGYIRMDLNDALNADNTVYFTIAPTDKKKILCVDGDVKLSQFLNGTFFLKIAFNPDPRFPGEIIPSICVPNELKTINLNDYSAIYLCNVSDIPPETALKLKDYMAEGGSLVYFLGDKVEPNEYAKLDPSIFPAEILKELEGDLTLDPLTVSKNHTLFKNTDGFGLDKVIFKYSYALAPKKDCFSYADFKTEGFPFMLEMKNKLAKSGYIIIFPFPVSRDWSEFPLNPAYLPFVHELAKYLTESSKKGSNQSVYIGESYKKTFENNDSPSEINISLPDGTNRNYRLNSATFEYKETDNPGIYNIKYTTKKGTRVNEQFAVNLDVDSGESDTKKQDFSGLKKYFNAKNLIFLIKDFNNVGAEVLKILRGSEIFIPLMIILMVLLFIENLLSLRRFL